MKDIILLILILYLVFFNKSSVEKMDNKDAELFSFLLEGEWENGNNDAECSKFSRSRCYKENCIYLENEGKCKNRKEYDDNEAKCTEAGLVYDNNKCMRRYDFCKIEGEKNNPRVNLLNKNCKKNEYGFGRNKWLEKNCHDYEYEKCPSYCETLVHENENKCMSKNQCYYYSKDKCSLKEHCYLYDGDTCEYKRCKDYPSEKCPKDALHWRPACIVKDNKCVILDDYEKSK